MTVTYDLDGRLETTWDEFGSQTSYTYDYLGRELSETQSDRDTNDTKTITTSATYDNNGNKLTVTDGNGNVTTYILSK